MHDKIKTVKSNQVRACLCSRSTTLLYAAPKKQAQRTCILTSLFHFCLVVWQKLQTVTFKSRVIPEQN